MITMKAVTVAAAPLIHKGAHSIYLLLLLTLLTRVPVPSPSLCRHFMADTEGTSRGLTRSSSKIKTPPVHGLEASGIKMTTFPSEMCSIRKPITGIMESWSNRKNHYSSTLILQ
jgi:hypothetical protein